MCFWFGVSFKELLVFGDGVNDLDMINEVGFGILFYGKFILKYVVDIVIEYGDLSVVFYV